jgi:uncharacterized membrane protein
MPLATLHEWLVFLHVLTAMVWVGGLVALIAFGRYILRTGEDVAVARFIASLRVVGPLVLTPAAALVLVFGIWLVLDSDTWTFGQTWIWLSLALLGTAVLVGAVFLSRAALAAERAAKAGDHAQARQQLRRWSWGIMLILFLLVVATWNMFFKPGV